MNASFVATTTSQETSLGGSRASNEQANGCAIEWRTSASARARCCRQTPAAAGGFAVSSLPSTKFENRRLGKLSDRTKARLQQRAHELLEDGVNSGEGAFERFEP
jgi:hypothetical protein